MNLPKPKLTLGALMNVKAKMPPAMKVPGLLTTYQQTGGTLSGGAGWYRIATQGVLGNYAIAGTLQIRADGGGFSEVWEVNVGGPMSGPLALCQMFEASAGICISQVRLSTNAGTSQIGLDVYVPGAAAVTFTFGFSGIFTPVTIPVVGAAVLPSSAVYLALDNSGTSGSLVTTTGNQTIGGQKSFSGVLMLTPVTAAALIPGLVGAFALVTDATSNTWGAVIVGGGAYAVLAFNSDGGGWTVAGI